ncbi:ubiquitin conjugating enzyme, partial [Teratosphaeria nubilosa]
QLQGTLPPGITLVSAPDLREWTMDLSIPENPLYPPHETYRLRFHFSPSYPIEAPEVTFVPIPPSAQNPVDANGRSTERKIPLHPHVYSNGIICLDLLDKQGWSPVHNVESVCISIQSMLAGNSKAERPPGDAEFVRSNRQTPRNIHFLYHDPSV